MARPFQVHLRGIIDLLSNHIYTDPNVFLRELLQNATDAIAARAAFDESAGSIRVTVRQGDGPIELRFEDDGIGLTEPEIHQFLATLGESSKRRIDGAIGPAPDYIGQFGIGLFSCFLVTDQIVVETQSARSGNTTWVWRGDHDGAYTLEPAEHERAVPGTTVILRARAGAGARMEPSVVRAHLERYGKLLPVPLFFGDGEREEQLNAVRLPWRGDARGAALNDEVLEYGRRELGQSFLDWIPLRSETGGADGVAFVLPREPALGSVRTHRVYLKGMLLSDASDQVLPGWAFFVHAIVDARRLRPTASREALYPDDTLATTQVELGASIRTWLVQLAKSDPDRIRRLIAVHHRAIKALSAGDDDVLALFAPWLPFETTMGLLTAGEIGALGRPVAWAASVDAYRQMASLAATQGRLLVNAGYEYDRECLRGAAGLLGFEAVELDPATLSRELDPVDEDALVAAGAFLRVAERALASARCDVELRAFRPEEVPAFYAIGAAATFRRGIERSQARAKGAWSDVLGALKDAGSSATDRPVLCFNYRSPLIRRLIGLDHQEPLCSAVQLLYVQAMMAGQHPLSAAEQSLMPSAITELIEWGLDGRAHRMLQ